MPDAPVGADDAAPDAPAVPLAFVTAPTLTFPSASATLTGLLQLESNRPTRVTIKITDPNRNFTITRTELATMHQIPVLGFRAATAHSVVVTITDAGGATLDAAPLSATTAALPVGFPTFATVQSNPAATEPGYTVTTVRGVAMAIDADGQVVWFVQRALNVSEVHIVPGGKLFGYGGRTNAFEFDVFGNTLRNWHVASIQGEPGSVPVAVDTFHHELYPLPNGNLIGLCSEMRSFPNYATSETDPTPRSTPTNLVGDALVEFKPDGTIVRKYAELDFSDPYRYGYDSFSGAWSAFYGTANLDWSHSNAVTVDPAGGYLVSSRHQDAVYKLDANGALQWILGPHDNWSSQFQPYLLTPTGTGFKWQYHQHAPRILPNGNILLFDNGNYRVSPPTAKPATNYSRAVEYAVNPTTKTVQQVWEFDAGRQVYALAMGGVQVGPSTGNVIVTFGSARRVIEVTHTTPPATVFAITSSDQLYRTERVPSLYW